MKPTKKLPTTVHPAAALFPLMAPEKLQELADDIRENGQRDPIIVDNDDQLIDGRNRLAACKLADVEPIIECRDLTDAEAIRFIVSGNLQRRDLNESQRAMIAADLANLKRGRPVNSARGRNIEPRVSQTTAAAITGASPRAVSRAARVKRKGSKELQAAVRAGKVSVRRAAELADPKPSAPVVIETTARPADTNSAVGTPDGESAALSAAAQPEAPEPSLRAVADPAPMTADTPSGDGGPPWVELQPESSAEGSAVYRVPATAPEEPRCNHCEQPIPATLDMPGGTEETPEGETPGAAAILRCKEHRRSVVDRIADLQEAIRAARQEPAWKLLVDADQIGTLAEMVRAIDRQVPVHICPRCAGVGAGCAFCFDIGAVDAASLQVHEEELAEGGSRT